MKCPACQASNPYEAKFCMNCGTPLAASIHSTDDGIHNKQLNSQSLEKFIPRELMTKFEAARAQDAMVGERRVITMLFCDVKGSTAAAEKVDPETWADIMNGIFEHMIRPIYKYEGTVPRLMGDAILAFFGAPIAHEDDPQRAVLAGLEIQEGIKEYAAGIRSKHGFEFGLRVGINTGLVVVGAIGSDLRMEYTAIGDAINLAARMEQTAAPGTVQISDDTYKLVAPFFDFDSLGEIEVKGKTAPIKTYRPLAIKINAGHLRGLDGLSSPLVGREAELALLNEQMKQLKMGTGSFVALIGEAGLGKSTLIAEFKKLNEEAGRLWLRGDALSYMRSASYFPWRQIIRQSIAAHEIDSPSDVREKLRYSPIQDVPFLEAILAIESEESLKVLSGFQGDALVQRIIDSARGYLLGLASRGPLVVILDDLHWADEASLNLLLNLSEFVDSQPILFICMLRPDDTAPSWDTIIKVQQKIEPHYHSIQLEPLLNEQTNILVENLLGVKDLTKNIRDMIIARADGNPFFIEELIRSLIETRQIVHENSHWRAVSGDAKVALPDTLRGVLGARIDRLPELTKHVLQNAAVIGRSFDLRVLKLVTRLNGGFDSQIQYLHEASLVEPIREEYTFRHVLIQEAVYDSILLKKRVELHRRIGETLEELHSERIEEFAPLIAYHFYNAQDPRSLQYDLLAGEKAARLYANVEASTHFSRALETARRNQGDVELIAKLHTQLGSVLELGGHYKQALQNYETMQIFGHDQGKAAIELSALMAKATIYSTYTDLHDSALSEQTVIQALKLSDEIGDRAAQVKLNWNLMLTYLFSSRVAQALVHGELALPLARELGNIESLAFVLNDLCRVYVCLGKFEEAHILVQEARELWRSLDNQTMLADSFGSEAEAYCNEGNHTRGLECAFQGLQVSEKIENLWGKAYNRMLASFIYFDMGKIAKAIQLANESILEGDRGGLIASSTSLRAELGWFYGYYGAIDKGLELAEQALEITKAKQPDFNTFPQAIIVRLNLMRGDLRSAEKAAGSKPLKPITIPYARYTIVVCLANVELALAQKKYELALVLTDDLLALVIPLVRIDIPYVLARKADALIGLAKLDEAYQVLTEACLHAEKFGSRHHLWSVLSSLIDVCSLLNQHEQVGRYRKQALLIVNEIAEDLREVGLGDSFLNQPRVQALMQ
jgi:class 3 adenylate cyclase/tetratricopeptide (TPR) repeat protein/ABC-type oligopeptide transport system ATPase subunit